MIGTVKFTVFGPFKRSLAAVVYDVVATAAELDEVTVVDTVDDLISNFDSMNRSLGDEHFAFATFLTGSRLFRLDALISGFLISPLLCEKAANLIDAVLFDDVDLLSLDKFMMGSDFCVFGN